MTRSKSKHCTTVGWSDMGEVKTVVSPVGIATVTLSNPTRMNAMQLGMWQSLSATMKSLSEDGAVRVIILRGEGDAAFVSGADISEFNELRSSPEAIVKYDRCVEEAEAAIGACPKPVIAAVSGVCYGGGLGIALSCDLRYANEDARFCLPAGKLGLGYAMEDVQRLHRALGTATTAELVFTAKVYQGQEAVKAGMAHACVDRVFDHANAIAERVAAFAPLTLRSLKMALQHIDKIAHAPSEQEVRDAVNVCFASEDYAEGRLAFAQKRTPVFKGR